MYTAVILSPFTGSRAEHACGGKGWQSVAAIDSFEGH